MKKILPLLFAAAILYSSCSKDHTITPTTTGSFKISFAVAVNDVINSTWQQVLGGKAQYTLAAKSTDSLKLSSIADSLDLKNAATYNKKVIAGNYDVALNTVSKAVADTFIRFTAQTKNFALKKDTVIKFAAATTDGVITIKKSLIANATVPTFIPAGSNTTYNFGLINGYYFIYVSGSGSGKVTFTEATTGDIFMKNLTVSAQNQYDLTATLNTNAVVIHAYQFKLKVNSLQ